MMENIILFIGPKFYGYERTITRALNMLYDKVYYICEYPLGSINNYSIFEKLAPFFVKQLWNRYEHKVLRIIDKKKIKNVFIIRGASLPESLIRNMAVTPGIKIFQYQWDSSENNPNSLMLMNYCQRNYTFDRKDAERIAKFNYLPLFYDWTKCKRNNSLEKNDILFLGSWSDKRLKLIDEIESVCEKNGMGLVKHIYMPFQTYIRKRFSGGHLNKRILSFRKISRNDYYNLLSCSRAVIDIPSPTQRGATMRSIEALSLRKKVISTNLWLKREIFYHPHNILIYPEEKDRLKDFLNQPFYEKEDVGVVLPLYKWLNDIFRC